VRRSACLSTSSSCAPASSLTTRSGRSSDTFRTHFHVAVASEPRVTRTRTHAATALTQGQRLECRARHRAYAGDDADIVAGDACRRRADGKGTSAWSCASTGQFFERVICAEVANDRSWSGSQPLRDDAQSSFFAGKKCIGRIVSGSWSLISLTTACRISVAISPTAQRRISGALTVPVPVSRRRRGRPSPTSRSNYWHTVAGCGGSFTGTLRSLL
jgi:hypothetical protein